MTFVANDNGKDRLASEDIAAIGHGLRMLSGADERLFKARWMVVAGALGMFTVAAPLLTIPADAQGEAERQKNALMQFSDELASCHAYCLVISRCFGAPKSAHAPADLSVSQQYAAWAKKLGQLAFVSSRGAGRADDATSAFVDRAKQNVMRRIRGNCANIASIVNEDGQGCGQLAEHPSDRLEVLLDRNP